MNPKQKIELEEFVEKLKSIKGRHTELVSVYIPTGFDKNTVAKQIEGEKSTASNIKSKSTRKNVTDALESIGRELKLYKQTPPNGLAIFAGNTSESESQENIEVFTLEPPQPLKTRAYRCDQEFLLEPLEAMLEVEEVYGLAVMDRKEATIGLLEGKQIKVLRKLTSGVPGKIRAGGQCLAPDMLIETKTEVKRIADIKIGDEVKAWDLKNNKIIFTKCKNKWKKIKNKYLQIILRDCWSIITSEGHAFFIEENKKIIEIAAKKLSANRFLITYYDKSLGDLPIKQIISVDKEIELIDIETEAGNFFANGILVHNSSQRFHRITEGLAKEFFRRIADAMKEVFFNLPKLKGIFIGGPIPTKEDFMKEGQLITALKDKVIALKDLGNTDESGLEELVELSKDELANQEIIHEKKLLKDFLETLGKHPEKTAYKLGEVKKALEYGAVEKLILSKNLPKTQIKELSSLAVSTSSQVEIVSVETEEGQQFFSLGGIGALLRFAI